jgi:hypothetical protein
MVSTILLRWLKRGSGSGCRQRPAGRRPFVPRLEALEDRTVLTTFPVTTLADAGAGSLRQAILDANATPGDDTITFEVTGTISLVSALPNLSSNIDIQGPGARSLTVSASGGPYSVLAITSGATVILSGLTLSNAGATGLVNNGNLTVNNCTIRDNNHSGVLNNSTGTLTINNSTISGNHEQLGGGGIGNFGTLTLNNSTVSGNVAEAYMAGDGGGISNAGPLTLISSTISENMATDSCGGIDSGGIGIYAQNTIIAGNIGFPDYCGFLTGGNNNFIGGDPRLGPLQDNGGPTDTMAPLAGSPALNAGDPDQLGTPDQRGVVRSGGVNIGAYQASASAFVLTAPAAVTAGVPFAVTVQAVDSFEQVAYGYTGTVSFSTTDPDPGVVLPAAYTFTAADQGAHTFAGGFTLVTLGDQTLTVTDLDGGFSASRTLTVNP